MKSVRKIMLSSGATALGWILKRASVQTMIFNAIRLNRSEIRNLVSDEDMKFLGYCFSRRARSRSQIMQDLWVCFELREKRGGFFVEFGATNGLKNSNTWLLETQLGWQGILAEPNPVWHADLTANRTAHIDHRCVSSASGEMVTFITTNDVDPELSAIADFSGGDHFSDVRQQGERIQVATISLKGLLDEYGAPAEIDYISIDTEGSELEILTNYDFSRRFKLISVEQNKKTEAGIQALLERHGYVRVFEQFSQWDGWYVSEELRRGMTAEIVAPES